MGSQKEKEPEVLTLLDKKRPLKMSYRKEKGQVEGPIDLKKIDANQRMIIDLLTEVVVLFKSRVDTLNELDKQDMELMNALIWRLTK